ncbi:bifunctional hydroxymethylpyrimidine kinase/phosphomethylpyrimidine kinase [Hydrogenovibrio sp. SC-1]|uniref:bifunctional hydroxymethylpyrimidine kinase/phosphomethylpyrimidine kinase n=1 Tax=Hydrogenovibrio sp. SC-1 TaxID=2065820 RepID=UPI000C7C7C80|nr:bifunctional hydroxymethylpyrimidine kinase/phosphomethylpyrimidine kinase [Hydrogenovibrio sp. SC-1]PLA75247.1 bifunctional hydroxymethylpyrimidine kinase/phosphomethylpyrimidine kinase [Hydrogenovibrio sp. SC-1]
MPKPTVLCIAGSDPYGGAGIQADLKSVHALGGYALTCVTALTAQNSQGVFCSQATSATLLRSQVTTLLDDMVVDAVKIGMLANAELIEVVAEIICNYQLSNVALDTPIISSSGHPLLEKDAIETLKQRLLPLATVITPNLPEVNSLLGKDVNDGYQGTDDEMPTIGKEFFELGVQAVVVKGGHIQSQDLVTDTLLQADADAIRFSSPRILTQHTHGTGCSFSSAMACLLAKGIPLDLAVKQTKQQMQQWLSQSDQLHLRYLDNQKPRKEPLLHL